jgi:hypothetical protein
MPKKAALPFALLATLATSAAAGGCGSDAAGKNSPTSLHTSVEIDGDPASTHKCKTELTMPHPNGRQLTATYKVTCNFPIASASTSLVIQGRPAGGDNTQWDNVDDPTISGKVPPLIITYAHNCVTGIEYQASASIDAVGVDGTPVNSIDTTTPRSYGASECSGK